MQARLDGDLQLGADAVGGRDQRIDVAGGLEVEQGPRSAEPALHAGTGGGFRERLDGLDERGAGVDVDARTGIGKAVGPIGHGVLGEASRQRLRTKIRRNDLISYGLGRRRRYSYPMQPITTTAQLADFCKSLQGQPFIAVDTEFMRETTYWPKLCLIQCLAPNSAEA